MKRLLFYFILVLIVNTVSINSYSGVTQFFEDSSLDDFKVGQLENVALDRNGYLTLSPSIKPIFEKEDILYVWTAVEDQAGNIYVGTGDKPRIYRISKTGKVELFFEAKSGTSITSLVIDSKDNLYASIIPGSKVMQFKLNGSVKVLTELLAEYIWKLKIDKDDTLLAATGLPAVIYRINSNGKKRKLYTAKGESHFMALDVDKKGRIYFGSEGKGIVYQWEPKTNKTKVLFDTYEDEVKDLILDNEGNLFFATSTKRKKVPPKKLNFKYNDPFQSKKKKGSQKTKKKKKNFIPPLGGTKTAFSKKALLRNSIYSISKKGELTKLFTRNNTTFLSLALDEKGNVYAGSGDEGVIYKIKGINEGVIFIDTDDLQVLSLINGADNQLIVTTGNLGKVYRVGLKFASKGAYLSKIFDAGGSAHWGKIIWDHEKRNGSEIVFYTRSGNSQTPDKTWSTWSHQYRESKGDTIMSPNGQYIQYKAEIAADNWEQTPVIKKVDISYLLENRTPQVDNIQLKKGVKSAIPPVGPFARNLPPIVLTLTWDAYDQDNDYLIYSIYYQEVGSDTWLLLKKDLTIRKYSFDSLRVADGKYIFKVIASDKMSNGTERIKIGEKRSLRYSIDNTPPKILQVTVNKGSQFLEVKGVVSDNLSAIKLIQYSLNGADWIYLSSQDMIYDSEKEDFSLLLDPNMVTGLIKGENKLIFKIADSNDNFATEEVVFGYE